MRRVSNFKTKMTKREIRDHTIIVNTGRGGVIKGETTRKNKTRAIFRLSTHLTRDWRKILLSPIIRSTFRVVGGGTGKRFMLPWRP